MPDRKELTGRILIAAVVLAIVGIAAQLLRTP